MNQCNYMRCDVFYRRFFILLSVTSMLSLASVSHAAQHDPQYWIWAGILPDEAPKSSTVIIYQGNFVDIGGHYQFEHKGIYPSPLPGRQVQLVFRLHELLDAEYIAQTIKQFLWEWKRHQVHVSGIQLDFDSPSAKLSRYAAFLLVTRNKIPEELEFSITGLGAWLVEASRSDLKMIHDSVDYVTYQFYVGRTPLSSPARYLSFLETMPYRFKVGLLAAEVEPMLPAILIPNPSYLGVTYFIQH